MSIWMDLGERVQWWWRRNGDLTILIGIPLALMATMVWLVIVSTRTTITCLDQGYPQAKTLVTSTGFKRYCIGYDGAVNPVIVEIYR